MKTKLEMAHEYIQNALNLLRKHDVPYDLESLIEESFDYADAMQAEAKKRKNSVSEDLLQEEWQPDWSKAPDWAKWWAMDGFSNKANWYKTEPFLGNDDGDEDIDEWNIVLDSSDTYKEAPSFGYTGNWKDSLRERIE